MELFTLVGRSGTGKSYHAMELCRLYDIDAIIDDGLFICHNTVEAGVSAKRQPTKIGAIKTALFQDDAVCQEVREAIERCNPARMLVLGTSTAMTDKILLRLGLVADEAALTTVTRIAIEDITTEAQRRSALEQRQKMGKHVIPAPALELKRNFAGYFMDPLRIFRGGKAGAAADRTVVRPAYSYLGEYVIDEGALADIVSCIAAAIPTIATVLRVTQDPTPEAFGLSVTVKIRDGCPLWRTGEILQREIVKWVEQMTNFNVTRVDIEFRA